MTEYDYGMKTLEKITISIPADLLREIERIRRKTGETRSAVFKRFTVLSLRYLRGGRRIRQDMKGYRLGPEMPDELIAPPDYIGRILDAEAPY